MCSTALQNLERLLLEGCIKLVKVHTSLGQHKKIVIVNLTACINLKSLPSRLDMDSLEKLILSGCSKLKKLPEFGENIKYLSKIDLKDCKTLGWLPCSIGNLKSLVTLNIFGCSKLLSLPDNLEENESIEVLDISGTGIRKIPSSINSLRDLRKLYANGCLWSTLGSSSNLLSRALKAFRFTSYEAPISFTLPPSISSLSSLKELKLTNFTLNLRLIPNDLGCLPSLEVPDLSGNDFSNLPSGSCILPSSFSSLSSLRELNLNNCNLCDGSIPNDLSPLSSLKLLRPSGNNFTNLPSAFVSNLLALEILCLNHFNKLLSLLDVPPHMEFINAICCHPSMKIPSIPEVVWRFFSSPNFQPNWLAKKRPFSLYVPRSEIPSWFHNQNLDLLDSEKTCIKVDISHFHDSSEMWGIDTRHGTNQFWKTR
ncbi:disease resistance protein RUN1-like [Prosopis cineraria]|uniref:disease resistance protein RUN1-like n=1 Tax=Prosopis cineraria TaxID=364024 RepID=UPI00240ECD4F|nr:disease resistance protein RUN1-like [Prosopis cineraria]